MNIKMFILLTISLCASHHAYAAEKPQPGPHEQQRLKQEQQLLNEDLFDAIIAKKGIETISQLIKKGADVNAEYKDKTPLSMAVENDDKKLAALLLKNGADIEKVTKYMRKERRATIIMGIYAYPYITYFISPVEIAIKNKNEPMIRFLFEHDARKNKAIDAVYTFGDGDKDMILFLLKQGAKPTSKALEQEVNKNDLEMAALLLKYDAPIPEKLLSIPVKSGAIKMAALLLKHGASVPDGLLQTAVSHDDMAMAELLLKHGANANAKGERGRTPLFTAAEKGNVKMASLLIKEGAKVNAKDEGWLTPLHIAAQKGKKGVAMLLLRNGAQLYAKSASGVTPKATARKFGHRNMFREWEKGKVH